MGQHSGPVYSLNLVLQTGIYSFELGLAGRLDCQILVEVLQATHGHGVQVNSNLFEGKFNSVSCGGSHSRGESRQKAKELN